MKLSPKGEHSEKSENFQNLSNQHQDEISSYFIYLNSSSCWNKFHPIKSKIDCWALWGLRLQTTLNVLKQLSSSFHFKPTASLKFNIATQNDAIFEAGDIRFFQGPSLLVSISNSGGWLYIMAMALPPSFKTYYTPPGAKNIRCMVQTKVLRSWSMRAIPAIPLWI